MMSVVRSTSIALLFAALSLIFSITASAQSDTAQILGFVKDASGAAIPGATVIIKNEATGVERRTTTNGAGYYVVPSLPSGQYTVIAESKGFRRFQKTGNKLDANIPILVDASLEIGAITETVEVTASTSGVQSETATVGQLIEASQIRNTELNGRNPLYLALLKPGVMTSNSLGGNSFGLTTGGLNINGSRTQDNLITFDGAVAVRTRSNGTSIGVADVDSVQEVQVLTADYSAEYGRSSGGQIRIVTKSGTRDFHGTAYEFFRNSALDANTWSRNRTTGRTDISGTPDPFRYNQYGYNLNGPIFIPKVFNRDRNKIFFFWGQEWLKQRRGVTAITTVPSLLMRNGDFSETLSPTNAFYGRTVAVNDPDTGSPFPGNVIPASRLSPNGIALLRAYPEPIPGFSQGKNNFIQQRPATWDQRKDTIAVDMNPGAKHQLRFRHQNYADVEVSANRSNLDRAPQIINRPNKTISANYTYTISPTLVNEFLGTVSIDRVYIFVDTAGNRYKRSNYGINYPYIYPNGKEITDKIPTVTLDNFETLDGGPYPSHSTGPIYDVSDSITKIKGNHTFKAGFLFERSGENDFDQINVQAVPGGTNNQNGQFRFDNSRSGAPTSGLAIANAALGLFTQYAEIGTRSFTPYRGQMYEWFAQDSWKVTPRMRLEFGLRHTIIQPYLSLWRNMVVFDPKKYDPSKAVVQDPKTGYILSGDPYNGVVIPGSGFTGAAKGRVPIADSGEFNRLFSGDPRYSQTHLKDFQPRLGIAYSLNSKTVVRAAAGKFITRLGVSDSVFLGGNPPLQPTVSISNGLVDNPASGRTPNFPLVVTSQDPIFQNPLAWAWNGTVQRELGFGTVVEIGYVGRRALRQQRERDINQPAPGTLLANPGINPDYLRPYKGFGPIRVTNNDANSTYNGLNVGLTRRFSKGLSFGFAYTRSKISDDGSNQRDIIPNSYDAHNLWGPAAYDRSHVVVLNYIYELPLFRGSTALVGRLLGGWQISGASQFQTGTPFTVGINSDIAGVGGVGQLDGNPSNKAMQFLNINGDPQLSRGDQKFSYSANDQNYYFRVKDANGNPLFVQPAAGTFSTQNVRNRLYGPGFQNWNLGLFKTFKFTERQSVQFRAEAFNFINHPNWGGENGTTGNTGIDITPTSGTFGKVTAKGGQRSLQLNLRYSF